jgi:hypothetical protein
MVVLKRVEDTKGVIRIRKSKKDRQHTGQKKDRQHTGQKTEGQTTHWPKEGQTTHWPKEEGQTTHWPKEKGQNVDLHNTTQKTKDRAPKKPTKNRG